MSRRFPVVQIEPEWVLQTEALGTKEKFWYRRTNKSRRWLFKYPQADTGQHWVEKIAAEIAEVMGIDHAKVELATFNGERGSASQSFISTGHELWHGNQILAGRLFGYDSEARFRHPEHTLEHIFQAIDATFKTAKWRRNSKMRIAAYLVLDAVIGNTDRHHENWGILSVHSPRGWLGFVAPSFDHASSLGRELRDDSSGKCRRRILETNAIDSYVEKGTGAIYWTGQEKKGPSPLQLVRLAIDRYPALFRPAVARVRALSTAKIENIFTRMPAGWMSKISVDFVRVFLAYSVSELLKLKE
ncbi:MAG TPA: HipA domain-containing protein [Chthoniobacterales bacterium]|nr:HipA domain-containing protein [Chthoniobacterales bacterium]